MIFFSCFVAVLCGIAFSARSFADDFLRLTTCERTGAAPGGSSHLSSSQSWALSSSDHLLRSQDSDGQLCATVGVCRGQNCLLSVEACDSNDAGQHFDFRPDGQLQLSSLSDPVDMCVNATGPPDWPILSGTPTLVTKNCGNETSNWTHPASGHLTVPDVFPGLCATAPPAPGPPAPVMVDLSARGPQWFGLGGLSAGASSRQLLDYVEPTRSQILDMFFQPSGGTALQILKTELSGDGQSSYGSETAIAHTPQDISFERGYEHWLLREAKSRNPDITTAVLAWTEPGWIGEFNSTVGAKYHAAYIAGVREHFNITFDYAGLWNEKTSSKDYILELRAAMDDEGLESTKIVAADGSSEIMDWMEANASVAAAIDVIGMHKSQAMEANDGERARALGKPLWNSEGNLIDGPMWPDGKYDQAVEWIRQVLGNYAQAGVTGMIQCPVLHAWSQNLARHNHGSAYFNDPWSGHYELGAPFWAQAHITQFTAPGWNFVSLDAGGAGKPAIGVIYAVFISPSGDDFSVVAVNTQAAPASFTLLLKGVQVGVRQLHTWRTTRHSWFASDDSSSEIDAAGFLPVALAGHSIVTLSTVATAAHADLVVPPRIGFPMPFHASFDDQKSFSPPKFFSDAYGSFEIHATGHLDANRVVRQSVQQSVIAWTRERAPFTVMPGGTNWMNYKVSLRASFGSPTDSHVLRSPSVAQTTYLRACGRIPVWPCGGSEAIDVSPPIGICLTLYENRTWLLQQFNNSETSTRLLGAGSVHKRTWHNFTLSFDGYVVDASLDDEQPVRAAVDLTGGVSGFGSGLHYAYFDEFSLEAIRPRHPSSFVLDLAPAQWKRNDVAGWIGAVLELPADAAPLRISALGRYAVDGNRGKHAMAVFRARDGARIAHAPVVEMANCEADLLGFCYTSLQQVLVLDPNERYYVVSEEHHGGDFWLDMFDPAAAGTMAHRISATLLTYRKPGFGRVAGRVYRKHGAWHVVEAPDAMAGPVNWLLEEGESQLHPLIV